MGLKGPKANVEVKLKYANYILENNACYSEAARYFGTSPANISGHLKYFKDHDIDFYNKVVKVARDKSIKNMDKTGKGNLQRRMEYANYIIENKCTYSDCSKHFGVGRETVRVSLKYFEKHDKELFIKIRDIVARAAVEAKEKALIKALEINKYKKRKPYGFVQSEEKQVEVAEWIIENKSTFEQAAEHFDVSSATISSCMKELKTNNVDLFDKMKEANIEGRVIANSVGGKGGWVKTVDEPRENAIAKSERDIDAEKTLKRMLWFKANLKPGDIIKYVPTDECCRKIVVGEKYENFFKTKDGVCLYYQHCRKVVR
nr:sporulation transcriptional regulator SpoIIID [uncultured Cellulosilyticum sp.]